MMKKKISFAFILLFFSLALSVQNLPRTNCNNCWSPDSLGNHRAVVQFNGTGKIAKVLIPWRRRDYDPDLKRIIIEDAKTHEKVLNVETFVLDRESGEIVFEPVSGNGIYYVYYMAYKNEGSSNYPKGIYLKPEKKATEEWLQSVENAKNIPLAKVTEFQSINAFNSFDPMEIIATKKETERLINENKNQPYLIFPEDRLHSIRMKNDLPERWIEKGIKT